MFEKLLLIPARPGEDQAAARRALTLSARPGVEIDVYDPVYEPLLEGYYGETTIYEPLRRRLIDERLGAARAIAEQLRKNGRTAAAAAVWDHPLDEAVARRVKERHIDLVVTQPSAGRTRELSPLERRLLSTCPAPVLIVRSDGKRAYKNIVAAVDPLHAHAKPAELDDAILAHARNLQRQLSAELHALHCFTPLAQLEMRLDIPLPLDEAERALENVRRTSLEQLLDRADVPRAALKLVAGRPETVLQQMAEHAEADLVIMGAMARGRLKELLIGSTADRFLRRSPVDVLVVKPSD